MCHLYIHILQIYVGVRIRYCIAVIWILASSDIGVLPDITVPDIGDLRISQYPYSDIGVTDIGELRYHSTTTLISEYQYSDIDSDIGGAVISEV